MVDLNTSYMGLRLKNPVVPSSSPLSHTVDGIRRLEDYGAAAVVMYSTVRGADQSGELAPLTTT